MTEHLEQESREIMNSSTQLKSSNIKNLSKINTIDDDNDIDDHSNQIAELNYRIKNDIMSYCLSFLQQDEETSEYVQVIWNKYLQCVGDIAIISGFVDTLPFHVKVSAFEYYQSEIIKWCHDVFHINCDTIMYSTCYSETLLFVIRYALKQHNIENSLSIKKSIVYVSIDFDMNLKNDLLFSISNIKFECVQNDQMHDDIIDCDELEKLIKRDLNNADSYPFMVVASAGSTLLGHCDELTKIKQLCHQYNLWLHGTGDLLGSLASLTTTKENVNISCDSLTIDIIKILGIQNLPYLTFFLRPITKINSDKQREFNSMEDKQLNNNDVSTKPATNGNVSSSSSSSSASSSTTTTYNHSLMLHPFHNIILNYPSINFLSIWAISQRCSTDDVLYHMKNSFHVTNLFIRRLKQMKTFRIINDNDDRGVLTYKHICSGEAPNDPLPKAVVLFRFETIDIPEIENLIDLHSYMDLLNLWLFDKLSQKYRKMNLELLKGVCFQMLPINDKHFDRTSPAHSIRFAPLEHLLDIIDEQNLQIFTDDIKHYGDILLATMTARARLSSSIAQYENLISIPMPHWAGVGAVRYIPGHVNSNEQSKTPSYDANTIQAELARKLQTQDSAFSLGGGIDEHTSMFYLRLGMIRKCDDLDTLLRRIADYGKETEIELKYVEDMAEKIKVGIETVQKDLQSENQQIVAKEGLLKQIPVISNIMSWWSSSSSTSSLTMKGRSFDLNSGRIESTEDTYIYRMQINKEPSTPPTHTDAETVVTSTNTDEGAKSTDINLEQENNQ